MKFLKIPKRISSKIPFWILFFEILIGLLGVLKIYFLSFDLNKVNEAAFSAIKHNTIALQYLAEGTSKGLDYSKDLEDRITKASNEILSYYGEIIPSCFFKQGVIPDQSGNSPGIKYQDLTLSIQYEGPAGKLIDKELAEGIGGGDGSKCDNTEISKGFIQDLKINFRYGNIIELLMGILGFILILLKWKELGGNSRKVKPGKRGYLSKKI